MEPLTDQEPLGCVPVIEGALAEIGRCFEGRPDEVIAILQRVQRELGYLPETALLGISQLTGMPSAKVFGIATFYAQFRLRPVGKHIIRVCRGTACHVRGADRMLDALQESLQIAPGETTKDGLFTLETVACFGSCALAPVVVVDDSVHGSMNRSKVGKLIDDIRLQ